jgi:hypothetical protein
MMHAHQTLLDAYKRVKAAHDDIVRGLDQRGSDLEASLREMNAALAASDAAMVLLGVSESPKQTFDRTIAAWTAKMRSTSRINSFSYVRAMLQKARSASKHVGRADGVVMMEACACMTEAAAAVDAFDAATTETFDALKIALKKASKHFNDAVEQLQSPCDSECDSDSEADTPNSDQPGPSPEYRMRCFQLRLRLETAVGARVDKPFQARLNDLKGLTAEDRDAVRDAYFTVCSGCHADSATVVDDAHLDDIDTMIQKLAEKLAEA